MMVKQTRRQFIKLAACAVGAALVNPAKVLEATARRGKHGAIPYQRSGSHKVYWIEEDVIILPGTPRFGQRTDPKTGITYPVLL